MYRKEKEKRYITRADIFIIGICLIVSAVLAIYFLMVRDVGGERFLQVSYDGEAMVSLNLEEKTLQKDTYYLFWYKNDSVIWEQYEEYPAIPEGISFNLLHVAPDDIRMEAADCRDQICVNHRSISDGGENIICLPHRLVVEIVGVKNEAIPDGMVK